MNLLSAYVTGCKTEVEDCERRRREALDNAAKAFGYTPQARVEDLRVYLDSRYYVDDSSNATILAENGRNLVYLSPTAGPFTRADLVMYVCAGGQLFFLRTTNRIEKP